MKIFTGKSPVLQMEMKKVFYGTFLFGVTTTMTMLVLVVTSDFLYRHGQVHLLLTLSGFIMSSCAIWSGIKVIFQSGARKKATDLLLLFFSSLHGLFIGLILLLIIF